MTPEHIRIVQHSWSVMLIQRPEATGKFLEILANQTPYYLRGSEQTTRVKELRKAITHVVEHLDNLEKFTQQLPELLHEPSKLNRSRHPAIRVALLTTLKLLYGRQWTRSLHDAWLSACNHVLETLVFTGSAAA